MIASLLSIAVLAAAPSFDRGTVVISKDPGRVSVRVEIAETPDQWARGLMFRRRLAANAGMVFLFESNVQSGFWMKNTRIPLSLAYFSEKGRILRIMHMQPCRADPCPTYNPNVAYRGALEVNLGAFKRWGVHRGDVITVRR